MPGPPRCRHELVGIVENDLAAGDLDLAMRFAAAIKDPPLELDRALRLVVALAYDGDPDRFTRLARRFLVRFLVEEEPTIEHVRKTADALHEVCFGTDHREESREALHNLAGQIRRRHAEDDAIL